MSERDDPPELKAKKFIAEFKARFPGQQPTALDALTLSAIAVFELDQRHHKRLTALEARLAALEGAQARTMADVFRGGYMPNTQYNRGDLIVDRGALWLAMQVSDERPGSTSAWKLIMKNPK